MRAKAALGAALALAALAPATTSAELIQRQGVRMAVSAALSPDALPRHGAAPVSVTLGGRILSTGPAPQLRRIAFAINSHGRLDLGGLPVCRVGHIQPSTSQEAMEACGRSLIGRGSFAADVRIPEQSPFPSQGEMLAFAGKFRNRPAVLAHIYGSVPAPSSYTLAFAIKRAHGAFGTLLEANLPQISGEWGNITRMRMTLDKGHLRAGCPAPAGFGGASFPLVRDTFGFQGGLTLRATLNRGCTVRG